MSITNIGNIQNPELIPSNEAITKEIENLIECCRLERKKYNEYSIIKDVALSCATEESKLSKELQLKLYDILMNIQVEQCLELTHNNTLLGVAPETMELTYDEKTKLREAVQQGIINKSYNLFKELDELGIKHNIDNIPHTVLSLSAEDKVIMDYKKQLNEKQDVYLVHLEEFIEIVKKILELKKNKLPESTNEKIHVCKLKLHLFNLQSQVMETKLRVEVFTEISNSMDAYRKFLKDILQQQTECKQDIEQLHELQEKYKQVSSKQYNEILQSYVKYKSIIENTKSLFNRLEQK